MNLTLVLILFVQGMAGVRLGMLFSARQWEQKEQIYLDTINDLLGGNDGEP